MDTRDGTIYVQDLVERMGPTDRPYMREMGYHPTPRQRQRQRVGRNDPCPCLSGRKFKKCCLVRTGAA